MKFLKNFSPYGLPMRIGRTTEAGWPDIVYFYKNIYVFLEVKTSKGKVTPLQNWHIERIKGIGGRAYVVRSVEEVEKICCQHLKLKNI